MAYKTKEELYQILVDHVEDRTGDFPTEPILIASAKEAASLFHNTYTDGIPHQELYSSQLEHHLVEAWTSQLEPTLELLIESDVEVRISLYNIYLADLQPRAELLLSEFRQLISQC